jgi:hypothetical protein
MRRWTADLPTFPLVYNVDIIPVKRGLNGARATHPERKLGRPTLERP